MSISALIRALDTNCILLQGVLFVGGTLTVTMLQLPKRFQLVNGRGSVDVGLRLVPFGVSSSVGGLINAKIMETYKIPLLYTVIFSALLQTVGFALLATVKGTTHHIPNALYGYEVVAGLGCGAVYIACFSAIQYAAERRDQGAYFFLGISFYF